MFELAIDIETYSSVDLKKTGVYKYAESPDFQILLFAYSVNGGTPKIVDLANGENVPFEIYLALLDPRVLKTAYNASFEIACISSFFGLTLDASQWSCTMALAAQAGLPFGLDMVSKVLKLDTQKDATGKALIKYFCVPCKPTKANGMRAVNLPEHGVDKWNAFKLYCMQDVAVEQLVRAEVLAWFKTPTFEDTLWALDQKINSRGVLVDTKLVNNALVIDELETSRLTTEMQEMTGIVNPNSDAQVKDYILESTGIEIESLNKEAMPGVYKQLEGTDMIDVLNIRQMLSRTSIKKFLAMQVSANNDNRVRGLFQYYGANRTGRWAGRNVQLQNLVRNNMKDLDFARELVKAGKIDVLRLCYDDVGKVLSNLIRSAFIPSPGNKLVVSDLSAIEARIIAWLAKEKWRMDVFASHGKIYEASASMMFNIPIDKITKDLRQKGKVAELALGYQGALGALQRMGGEAMGLSKDEMWKIVKSWRKASPAIVRLWNLCNDAAITVITEGGTVVVNGLCKFYRRSGHLHIQLPSGRSLIYLDASYDGKKITYMGMDQVKKIWCKQDTYGGKLVENIVQAIARDVLANALVNIDQMGFDIIMHVHDEIVIEQDAESADLTKVILNEVLSQEVPWAKGLILGAETFIADYYTK